MQDYDLYLTGSWKEIREERNDSKASHLRKAIELIEKGLETCPKQNPNWAIAVNNRSHCNYHLARFDKARSDLEMIKETEQDRMDFHINYSAVLDELRLFDDALKHSEKAVELAPESHQPYVNLSSVRFSLKQYDKAIEAATKSLQIRPNPYASLNRAAAYAKSGELEKAFEDLELSYAMRPGSLLAHADMGYLYMLANEKFAAVREYKSVLKKVASFEREDRSIRHYYPAIIAEAGLEKLGKKPETNFRQEALELGIPKENLEF